MKRGFVGVVVFTILLFGLVPSVAQAAEELALSWDNKTWSDQLGESMFDPAMRWVPGDVGSKVFYVRNGAGTGADLSIGVVTGDEDALLCNEDIQLSARVGAEDWVDLPWKEQNFRLNSAELPAGESRKVEVMARFEFASLNRSQHKQSTLKFRVTLSDAQGSTQDTAGLEGVEKAPSASTGPGNVDDEFEGPLPNAGAPAVGWIIVAAGVAIGSGLALITRYRRREGADDDAAH